MEKINQLKLEGGYFTKEAKLNLFTDIEKDKRLQLVFEKSARVSLVYGINGSGKSSISRAIKEYASEDSNKTFSTNKFVDETGKEIILTPEQKEGIHVYNEDFIDENIKLKEDELGAIVIFGKQVKWDSQISNYEKRLNNLSKEMKRINLEKYDNEKFADSVSTKRNTIIEALSNGYAVRDKAIKENQRNTSIKEETLAEVSATVVGKVSRVKLQKRYSELLELITKIRSSKTKIKVSSRFSCNYDEPRILELLSKKIERPGTNLKEQEILLAIEQKGNKFVLESEEEFSKKDTEICPYCFQPVYSKYKESLLEAIHNVFNKEYIEHIKDLERYHIDLISLDLEDLKIVSSDLIKEIYVKINKCNQIITRYNNCLDKKKENVFKVINVKSFELDSEITELKAKLQTLASNVNTYNQFIDNLDNYIAEAKEVNLKLAKIETKPLFDSLKQTLNNKEKEQSKKDKLDKEEKSIHNSLEKLYLKKSSLDIALGLINKYLIYIFSSEKRLRLELTSDKKYRVISKGHNVKPKQLSIGERNALALSYFFSLIQEESVLESSFQKEYFLVLDDPVSSFDFDNKVGIYSFLNSMFQEVLNGNKTSRILILTHELDVLSSMKSLFNNIRVMDKNKPLRVYSITKKILPSKKIIRVHEKDIFNNYKELLDETYEYAISKKTDKYKDLTIGNIMRKAVEAFTTFQYNTGISEVLQNDEILSNIKDESQREYFKRRMFKLMFNDDSHTESAVKNYSNKTSLEFYGTEEKIKIAKEILSFIYMVNSTHIKLYFKDNQAAIDNIKAWSVSPFIEVNKKNK